MEAALAIQVMLIFVCLDLCEKLGVNLLASCFGVFLLLLQFLQPAFRSLLLFLGFYLELFTEEERRGETQWRQESRHQVVQLQVE